MTNKLEKFNKAIAKPNLPDIRPGDTVKIYQKLQKGEKHKVQTFEGLVMAKKHGNGISGTITVRKVSLGVGVEMVFPLHSPAIDKIEILKRSKVKKSKLYYLREAKGRKARLKKKEFQAVLPQTEEKQAEEISAAEQQ